MVGLGDLTDPKIWLSLGGLALIGTLLFHQVSRNRGDSSGECVVSEQS